MHACEVDLSAAIRGAICQRAPCRHLLASPVVVDNSEAIVPPLLAGGEDLVVAYH